uniref:Uncharacterized protein n=1 Tax=Anopheles atroparvus TaxID=41427 RepID=A0A182IRH8_ANOAO
MKKILIIVIKMIKMISKIIMLNRYHNFQCYKQLRIYKWIIVLMLIANSSISERDKIRVRRQFFAPLEECAITPAEVDEIVQLTKLIEGHRASRKRPAGRGNAQTPEGTDECSRYLRQLKGSIQDVLTRYGTMQQSSVSQSQYELMKAQQESEIANMLRRVDNLERETEQRFRAEIERLRNSLQELRRRLNENLRLLEQERLAGLRAQEALCVSYIQGGNVNEAVRIYRGLNGSYDAIRLTNDTYQGDADMVKPLVEFFAALQEDAQLYGTISGLEELHRQTERNNQLDRERSRTIFHSLVGLESFYTEPNDINRVQHSTTLYSKLRQALLASSSIL